MTEKDIIDTYCRIRTIDHTIPDDVLDFMKIASLKELRLLNGEKLCQSCGEPMKKLYDKMGCFKCMTHT